MMNMFCFCFVLFWPCPIWDPRRKHAGEIGYSPHNGAELLVFPDAEWLGPGRPNLCCGILLRGYFRCCRLSRPAGASVCGCVTASAWLDTKGRRDSPAAQNAEREDESVAMCVPAQPSYYCSLGNLFLNSMKQHQAERLSNYKELFLKRERGVKPRPREKLIVFLRPSIRAVFHRLLLHHYLSLFPSTLLSLREGDLCDTSRKQEICVCMCVSLWW